MLQIHPLALEVIQNGGFPVKHFSYSSIKEYLGNPRSFLKKYVRYEFDDTTGDAFMIGKSVHKALEIAVNVYKDSGELLDVAAVQKIGFDYFIGRQLEEIRGKALTKYIQNNGGSAEFPIFTKEISDEEIHTLYLERFEQAKEYVACSPTNEDGSEITPEQEVEYVEKFLRSDVENSLIKLKSKQTIDSMIEDAKNTINIAIQNIMSHGLCFPEGTVVHSTEREEKVFFCDENGEEMPIALKAISDRIDIGETFCDITDYKTCDKFSKTDAEKADYEMQAGANYFTALVATGKTPRKMYFVEILKEAPGYILEEDPDRRLLKDDLIELVKTRLGEDKLATKETVDSLRTKLIEGGVLVQEKAVNVFEIDFEQRPDVVATFLSLYKGVVNMVALSEICGVYLPNIGAQWGGLEAYQDFKEFDSISKAPTIKRIEVPEEDPLEIL